MEGGQKNRTSLSTNLADMAKIKGALIGDISRQTGSVLQGGHRRTGPVCCIGGPLHSGVP